MGCQPNTSRNLRVCAAHLFVDTPLLSHVPVPCLFSSLSPIQHRICAYREHQQFATLYEKCIKFHFSLKYFLTLFCVQVKLSLSSLRFAHARSKGSVPQGVRKPFSSNLSAKMTDFLIIALKTGTSLSSNRNDFTCFMKLSQRHCSCQQELVAVWLVWT